MTGFTLILHPTDLSDGSMAAFRMACRVAREGSRIVVLHVLEKSLLDREGYLESLNRRLGELEPPGPGVTVEIRLAEGHAVDEILRAAEELSCDIIVMGGHAKAGLRERLLGGVADAVLRRSRRPVLVVKPPVPEAAHREASSAGAGADRGHVVVF